MYLLFFLHQKLARDVSLRRDDHFVFRNFALVDVIVFTERFSLSNQITVGIAPERVIKINYDLVVRNIRITMWLLYVAVSKIQY